MTVEHHGPHHDILATDLEDEPLGFGREHLAAQGWDPGTHAPPVTECIAGPTPDVIVEQ